MPDSFSRNDLPRYSLPGDRPGPPRRVGPPNPSRFFRDGGMSTAPGFGGIAPLPNSAPGPAEPNGGIPAWAQGLPNANAFTLPLHPNGPVPGPPGTNGTPIGLGAIGRPPGGR